MISVTLKGLYDELERIGIAFDGRQVRNMEHTHNGLLGCCDFGVLCHANKETITIQKMAEILEIAKKWDTYVVLNTTKELGLDALNVCFIKGSVFQTWLEAGELVYNALTSHFLHYQEDAKILALEEALEQSKDTLSTFCKGAYDSRSLHTYSTSIRSLYLLGTFAIPNLQEIEIYMEDVEQQEYAVSLCWANHCLELVRKL